MDVRVLHHVSLPVGDLERSRRFYREVLGLEEIARPPFPFPGAWFRLGDREPRLIAGEGAAPGGAGGADPRRFHFAVRVACFGGRWSTFGARATARTRARGTRCACWRCPGRWWGTPSSTSSTPTGT